MTPEDTEEERRMLHTLTRFREEQIRQAAHVVAIWVVLGSVALATFTILYVRCTKGHA